MSLGSARDRVASVLPPIVGFVLGVVLSFVGLTYLVGLSDQILLGAYVIVVLLVSASLTSSATAGFVLGLFALIGQALTDMVYFGSTDLSLVPYAAGFTIFVGMIPIFPLAGAFGGYLGREYFTESRQKRRSGEKDRGRRARR